MNEQLNITRIKAVYNALGELKDKVVFVGGATVALYADRRTGEVRPTEDVDILVEIYTYKEYAELEEKLRTIGFENDITAKFVGRYKLPGIIVDVMPINEEVLGFSNQWYPEGYSNAIDYVIDEHITVKIFTAPYFIASKLEAFKTRGKNKDGELDGRTSRDFEDLIYVMENRSTLWDEMEATDISLNHYLKTTLKTLFENPNIEEWIEGHAGYSSPPMTYYIIDKIKKFTTN